VKAEASKQGAHDGACGFYSIGNALAIVCPKIRPHLDDIFYQMFRKIYLLENDGSHFIDGLGRNVLNSVLSNVLEYILYKYDINLTIKRPFWNSKAESLSNWRNCLSDHFNNKSRTAAIIGYEYCRNHPEIDWTSHWTVIKKITKKSMHTFDSDYERKYLPFNLCRIWDAKEKHKARPYKIDTSATFLLSID
jgi:hypothetical protein